MGLSGDLRSRVSDLEADNRELKSIQLGISDLTIGKEKSEISEGAVGVPEEGVTEGH